MGDANLCLKNLEVSDKDPTKIKVLYITKSASPICPRTLLRGGIGSRLTSLVHLTINNCGLKSLDGFPLMPSVKALNLDFNSLRGGLDKLTKMCPNVQMLHLSSNNFLYEEDLRPLRAVQDLSLLVLHYNPLVLQKDWDRKLLVNVLDNLIPLHPTNKTYLSIIGEY